MRIQLVESDAEILACFPVMRHLRDVESPEAFLASVRACRESGYRLAFLAEDGAPLAVAGFRFGRNLAWGRYLYVHDLVTLPEARSQGRGAKLLSWLVELARSSGAGQVHLDSGLQRTGAHRFYRREGFEAPGLHFRRVLQTVSRRGEGRDGGRLDGDAQ